MSQQDPQRWESVLALFDDLVGLPETIRHERLATVAESEPELAAEVAAMLAADQHENGVLETSLDRLAPEFSQAMRALPKLEAGADAEGELSQESPDRDGLQKAAGTQARRRQFAMGNLFGTLILPLLATGAFAIAWSMVKEELSFLADSRIVDGQVVGHEFERGSDSGPMSSRSGGGYYPIVRYSDESGREHQVRGRVGAGNRQTLSGGIESGSNYHAVGSSLRVAYRRDDPEDARVLGFGQQYLFPLIFAVIGLMLLMFAVLVFRDGISPAA